MMNLREIKAMLKSEFDIKRVNELSQVELVKNSSEVYPLGIVKIELRVSHKTFVLGTFNIMNFKGEAIKKEVRAYLRYFDKISTWFVEQHEVEVKEFDNEEYVGTREVKRVDVTPILEQFNVIEEEEEVNVDDLIIWELVGTQTPQEETQAPQEEMLCPLTTMELIENSLELIHNYGVNLESCLELPNGVFISRCNDSSILSCGNENYIFHFNVYSGELYTMYNAQTSTTEKWGNEPQKAYHDIKKVIESEYKQFSDKQTQEEFDKLLKPYTQAFETYKNFDKEETKKRMIETLKTYQKVVLNAKKNGLINETYNVNMFINSMKKTCKDIQKEIVLNKKSHDDFIESRIIFLSLETLHKYYENESFGFGLITSEIKNIIESVTI